MRVAGPRRLGRFFLLVGLALQLSACLPGLGSANELRDLDFFSLAVPSQVAVGDSAEVEVGFLVGPNLCWRLDGVGLVREQSVIHIAGTSVRSPSERCLDTFAYDAHRLALPPLPVGVYRIVAGELEAMIAVVDQGPKSPDTVIFRGKIYPNDSGCALEGNQTLVIAFSGLPPDLERGEEYLIYGNSIDDDPCTWPGELGRVDHFVAVDDVQQAGP